MPSSQTPERDEYIAALRQIADWLEQHPEAPTPSDDRLLVPLMANAAVQEFAARHDCSVVVDKDGNASVSLPFGPITYHVYGYADWEAWHEQHAEKTARAWANSKGMTIEARDGGAR